MSKNEFFKLVEREINAGIQSARDAGVVCGNVFNLTIKTKPK